MLYDADKKLEVLMAFVSQRYQAFTERQVGSLDNYSLQDSIDEEADLDQLDTHLKQFGKVIWTFADTSSRLDTTTTSSSVQSNQFSFEDLPQWMESSSSSSIPLQNRTEWEDIWRNLFGSVQLDLETTT